MRATWFIAMGYIGNINRISVRVGFVRCQKAKNRPE